MESVELVSYESSESNRTRSHGSEPKAATVAIIPCTMTWIPALATVDAKIRDVCTCNKCFILFRVSAI